MNIKQTNQPTPNFFLNAHFASFFLHLLILSLHGLLVNITQHTIKSIMVTHVHVLLQNSKLTDCRNNEF